MNDPAIIHKCSPALSTARLTRPKNPRSNILVVRAVSSLAILLSFLFVIGLAQQRW